jgi:hypothetical protein
MMKDKIITLFIAFLCVGFLTSSFTVICHGSDGHIALEPVVHNHCLCPESNENAPPVDSTDSLVLFSNDHNHCTDILAASSIIISIRKIKPLPFLHHCGQ